MVGFITPKECSLAYPATVILTVQSMCDINTLLSPSAEGRNSQELKDSQQLIVNPGEFLQYLRPCKISSLRMVHIACVVLLKGAYTVPVTTCTNIVGIWFFKLDVSVATSQEVLIILTYIHSQPSV